jgi:toxin ParE1/3/4
LVDHYAYLFEAAGADVADRFLTSVSGSFDDLARQPAMGAPLTLRDQKLAGMRKWRVRGFEDVLIFYFPRLDGVSIVRVLHAARDWWRLLGMAD